MRLRGEVENITAEAIEWRDKLQASTPAPAMPNGVEAARVLADFAETAPGRLPGRVQDAIATVRAADNRGAAGVDSEEDAYVIERMGKMLAEIAVIVNGPEPDMTRWSYHDLPEKVRALKTAPDAATVGEAVAWRHPDEVPKVVPGGNAYFWVAVRRKHDGRVYSFPAQYLNAMLLCNEWSDDTERSGNRYHHGPTCEVERSFPATGWHDAKEHGEYDCVYQPLLGDADELVAWREVADYPATTPPPAEAFDPSIHPIPGEGQQPAANVAQATEALRAERDAAFRMSRCECASDECCANLVKHQQRAERLAEALRDAATSMQTIADKAGRDEYLMTMDEVRGYANSRANAALAALHPQEADNG